MTETIIKRKIIKKRKKRAKKVKPTQEQKQTQIINIYNSSKLRNPLGLKRQKEKDRISPLENRRVYRPIAINQHVNSFEVEQRLYSKLADENRLNQISQQRERTRIERERLAREQQMKTENENYQQAVFDFIKRKEARINEQIRNQIDERLNTSFESIPSKGYGDEPLDKPAELPPDPIEDNGPTGSTPSLTPPQIAEPISGEKAKGIPEVKPVPAIPPPTGQAEIIDVNQATQAPITIPEKFNSLNEENQQILKKEFVRKFPNTKLFKKKKGISSEGTIKKQVKKEEQDSFNLIYEKLITGQDIPKRGRKLKK
jgi:hypothetical protein